MFLIITLIPWISGCGSGNDGKAPQRPLPDFSELEASSLVYLEKSLKDDPDNALAWFRKGRILERIDTAKAIKAFEKAVELDNSDTESWLSLARVSMESDTALSRNALEQAGKLGTNAPEFWQLKAEFALADGDRAGAEAYLDRMAGANVAPFRTEALKARLLLGQGDTLAAEMGFRKSFGLKPTAPVFESLYALLLETGKGELAANLSKKAESLLGENLYRRHLADAWLSANQPDSAKAVYRSAYLADTLNAFALKGLARTEIEKAVYDSALFYAARAIDLDSLDLQARLLVAEAYRKKYWYNASFREYTTILKIDSANAEAKRELPLLIEKIEYWQKRKAAQQSKTTE
ncbi:tetratricopeptide repeat protein [Fulvitalea axinellae]|uniref:tetratricopeptide repeat protein n=1 Tax=Fulvitalea axinellae TaxID=1182444 RepID=UPI0030CA13C7